jgi:hypothetical protein
MSDMTKASEVVSAIWRRLKEPSTWAGIGLALTAIEAIAPQIEDQIGSAMTKHGWERLIAFLFILGAAVAAIARAEGAPAVAQAVDAAETAVQAAEAASQVLQKAKATTTPK